MRLGFVGAGRMGLVHGCSVRDIAPTSRLFVYDPSPEAVARFTTNTGATAVASPEDLVDAVDAVVVTSPATERMAVMRHAMAARLPVFCEKPLAAADDDVAELGSLARLHGGPVQVGFQRRCDGDYRRLRELVGTGQLGDILLIRTTAFDHVPPASDYVQTAGNIFVDCLIHDIDAVQWLTGQAVTTVKADGAQLLSTPRAGISAYDVATVVMTLTSGARAVLTASRLNPRGYDHRIEVLGTKDSVSVGLDEFSPLNRLSGAGAGGEGTATTWRDFTDRFAAAYREEMRVFLRVAAGEQPSPCTVDEAAAAQRVAVAAAESARSGQRMAVPDGPDCVAAAIPGAYGKEER